MRIGKGLVHDCYGRIGLLIGRDEESALAQACADGCKVVAAYVSDECNLARYAVNAARLALEEIKRGAARVGEGNIIDGAGADDARKSAHLLQHRVDEGHTAV